MYAQKRAAGCAAYSSALISTGSDAIGKLVESGPRFMVANSQPPVDDTDLIIEQPVPPALQSTRRGTVRQFQPYAGHPPSRYRFAARQLPPHRRRATGSKIRPFTAPMTSFPNAIPKRDGAVYEFSYLVLVRRGVDLGSLGGRVCTKTTARSSQSRNERSSEGGGSTKT